MTGMASKPKVYIKKLKNGHYQLIVERKPYIVKGVCYNPIPIGKNHQDLDGYDWWSDPNKPWMVDGKLMQDMGVNTVRFYQPGQNPESVKKVIRDLYENFGIRTIMGHWLGFWEYPCPFYADKDFQARIKKEVLEMVNLYKDQPGILMWILGNENNYSFSGRVNPWSTDEIDREKDPQKQKFMRAKIYYSFVNEIAREIKTIDPAHPVALGNGELISLDVANEVCPDIDLVACIIYRGKTFGNLFNSLRATFDRPILLSEFGADAYDAYLKKEDQNMQAFFLESQWRQIYENLAKNKRGAGNCLGGTMFEWTDEWWKHNESDPESWKVHDTESHWSNSSYYFDIKAEGNKNMNEEWFGIVAIQEELENGINKRIPRKAYYVLKEFWKNPILKSKVKSKKSK
jgi:endo-1,4-beta-mannosidase